MNSSLYAGLFIINKSNPSGIIPFYTNFQFFFYYPCLVRRFGFWEWQNQNNVVFYNLVIPQDK